MMNNNKILTVSYGTFSCTLEGFEDSFGTMKVIAEYFRDLAADDRYFGAEPPQPDAEMLARIAEKEVSRRVEAREQDGRIVLSALESSAAPATAAAFAAAPGLLATDTQESVQPATHDHPADSDVEEDILEEDVLDVEEDVLDVLTEDMPADDLSSEDPAIVVEAPAEAVSLHADHAAIEEDEAGVSIEDVQDDATPLDMVSTQDLTDEIEEAPADTRIADIAETVADEDSPVEASDIAPTAPVSEDSPAEDLEVAEAAAGDAEESAPQVVVEDAFEEDENDIVPGQPDTEVEAFFASAEKAPETVSFDDEDDVADIAQAASPVAEDSPAPAPEPDSIAAKLQRIREVVAQHDDSDEADDYLEDEHAEAKASGDVEVVGAPVTDEDSDEVVENSEVEITDAIADIEAALAEDNLADEAVAEDAAVAQDVMDEAEDAAVAKAKADVSADEALEADNDDDDLTAILNRLEEDSADADDDIALDDVSLEEAAEEAAREPSVEDTISNLFESGETATQDAPKATETVKVVGTSAKADSSKRETAKATASRARVIKVKRADLEAAIDNGDLEEYGDDAPSGAADAIAAADKAASAAAKDRPGLDDLAPAKSDKTALSKDEEDDLARELAELEQDIAQEAESAKDIEPAQERPAAVSRHVLPSIDDGAGSDVNRLLAETDHQMDEPESATRRDAFAHLRAAVAAKKADDTMNGDTSGRDSDDVYREDLAEVVRPRRPVSAPARTERPSEPRPAPLKLVAEQRVNASEQRDNGPVKPRRVAAVTDGSPSGNDGESFADFAADMGASTLPQLLEAAAAYMSFVEGREQFSRPQLMTKVRQSGAQDGFSREDGLRSFGQLLRAGKIEKLKGGRFTVSDEIGYRPDERAAG